VSLLPSADSVDLLATRPAPKNMSSIPSSIVLIELFNLAPRRRPIHGPEHTNAARTPLDGMTL
jgi:hypothetical protein